MLHWWINYTYVRKKNHLQDTFGKIRPWNVCCMSCTHNRDGIIFLFLMRKRCPIFAGPWIAGVNFHGTIFRTDFPTPLSSRKDDWGFFSSMSALEVRVSCVLSHFLLKDNSELEDNYSRVSCCLGLNSDLECLQNFPNMASSCYFVPHWACNWGQLPNGFL